MRETPDAVSLVFDVPPTDPRFAYRAGQFLTLRVSIDGQEYRRCYSMSSSPAVHEQLRITVKRDRDGVVSNWLNDTAAPGDRIQAAAPEGRFVMTDGDREIIAFAGGSGITPVLSLIHTALATTPAGCGCSTPTATPIRSSSGTPWPNWRAPTVTASSCTTISTRSEESCRPRRSPEFLGAFDPAADYYVCGPGPYMDTVEGTLRAAGIPGDRVHVERFTVAPVAPGDAADSAGDQDRHHHPRPADRRLRVPGRQHHPADRPAGRAQGAVVVRNRFVRNMYRPGRRGHRPDAQQRRTRRRR